MAISPQAPELTQKTVRQHKLTFDVLADPGNEVAAKFGLRFSLPDYLRPIYTEFGADLAKYNGDGSWTLPVASRFVIDSSGIVRSVDADADYTVRPEASATVDVLKSLRSGS